VYWQLPLKQLAASHWLPGAQSVSLRHATQLLFPSQYWPPFDVHELPAESGAVPQKPLSQMPASQSLAGVGHSLSLLHCSHWPSTQARPASQA
jgi:hypothetical protein